MSRFYGTVEGQAKTVATRRGGPKSGVTTYAAGWKGAIRVDVQPDHENPDQDNFTVFLVPWQNSGGRMQTLAQGVLRSDIEVSEGVCEVVQT